MRGLPSCVAFLGTFIRELETERESLDIILPLPLPTAHNTRWDIIFPKEAKERG